MHFNCVEFRDMGLLQKPTCIYKTPRILPYLLLRIFVSLPNRLHNRPEDRPFGAVAIAYSRQLTCQSVHVVMRIINLLS